MALKGNGMTDRELLELAAKAAGMKFNAWSDKITDYDSPHYGDPALHDASAGGQCNSWNPLTDDGDALRLAAKLEMEVKFSGGFTYGVGAVGTIAAVDDMPPIFQIHQGDPHAAARRAIVRAAAAAAMEKGPQPVKAGG